MWLLSNFRTIIRWVVSAALLLGAIFSPGLIAKAEQEIADYLYKNAAIYTVNDEQPWAEAIAIAKNKIVYVGDEVGFEF